jgi:cell division septation protein DedD
MPFVQRAAEHGDARAQYVYGTALFNGDVVARDWPRAYAFMSRAASQGLPYAQSQLREMEQHIPAADRARGTELAASLAQQAPAATSPTRIAAADPAPSTPNPPRSRVATTSVPTSTAADTALIERPTPPPAPPSRPVTTAPPPSAPAATERPARPAPAAPVAAAGGRWRVQLGAFSSDANARRAWSAVAGRMPHLQPFYVRAGNLVRLQAGPLQSRAAAERTCAGLSGEACFPVAP